MCPLTRTPVLEDARPLNPARSIPERMAALVYVVTHVCDGGEMTAWQRELVRDYLELCDDVAALTARKRSSELSRAMARRGVRR